MAARSGFRRATLFVVLAVVTSACPGRTHPHPVSASPTPSAPHGTATVTIAYPYEPSTLDPFARGGLSPATRDLVRILWPGFFRQRPDGSDEPWLLSAAPEITVGPPFTETITLRSDARWSDGGSITVADVRATWQRALRAPPEIRAGYDAISRIDALSSTRARIVFTHAYPNWRALFSAGLGVLPAHAMPSATRWPVSGGPFVLRAVHAGLEMIFDRNVAAWDDVPDVKTVRVVFVPDATAALELFKAGRVGVLGPYLAPDWRRRMRAAGATVTTDSGLSWVGLVLSTRHAPTRTLRIRRDIAGAFDRARIVRGLVQDEGSVLTTPDPGGDPLRTTSYPAAKKRSGARPSVTLAYVGADDLAGIVARGIQFQTRALFDIQPIALDADVFWSEWLSGSRMQAAVEVFRDPPGGAALARFGTSGAGLVASLPVVPLFRLAVSLGFRSSAFCGSAPHASAEADGPFWDLATWEPCSG